jgi:large subunit ribosomal protein L6
MSRIGKKPILIPEKVKVSLSGSKVLVEGPKGKGEVEVHPKIKCEIKDGQISFARSSDNKFDRALHGMVRSLVNNIITGVTTGFEKNLEIQGVGFKAELKGQTLKLSLGFSHPIEYSIPAGVKIETPIPTNVKISGPNKQLVGQAAADIRRFYEVEPYKGKGIRYAGEHVRRKQGKTVGK